MLGLTTITATNQISAKKVKKLYNIQTGTWLGSNVGPITAQTMKDLWLLWALGNRLDYQKSFRIGGIIR